MWYLVGVYKPPRRRAGSPHAAPRTSHRRHRRLACAKRLRPLRYWIPLRLGLT